jgi:glycosyltransferase involved in cell wall biosynthesis
MRIAVLPSPNRIDGGIFQYGLSFLEAVEAEYAAGRIGRPVLIHPKQTDLPVADLRRRSWECVEFPFPSRSRAVLARLVGEGMLRRAWRSVRTPAAPTVPPDPDTIVRRPELRDRLRALGVDLLVLGYPNALGFETGLPYVMPIHDMQHRLQPEFPEVSAEGEWERREYVYRNGAVHATVVLADSEIGKQDILDAYGPAVDADRIVVLPVVPPHDARDIGDEERLRVRRRYALPPRYVFYPAQFWPHKNHARLVEALGVLKERGVEVHLALSGAPTGALREETHAAMHAAATRASVEAQVHELGYVRDEDMPALYAEAVALTMPTFFGPTNIPPLEAWAFGCPVLTSDIHGVREHSGDAALLVDPRSASAIAEGIEQLWQNEALRGELVERGRRRLSELRPEAHGERVRAVLQTAEQLVQTA